MVRSKQWGGTAALKPLRDQIYKVLRKDLPDMIDNFPGARERILKLMEECSREANVDNASMDTRDCTTLSTRHSCPSSTLEGSVPSSSHITATSAASIPSSGKTHPDDWTTIADWLKTRFMPAVQPILPALFDYLSQDGAGSNLIGKSLTDFKEIMQNLWESAEEPSLTVRVIEDWDRLAEISDRLWDFGDIADQLWKNSKTPTTRHERFARLAECIRKRMPPEEGHRAMNEEQYLDQDFRHRSRLMEPDGVPPHVKKVEALFEAISDPQVIMILARHKKERENSQRSH